MPAANARAIEEHLGVCSDCSTTVAILGALRRDQKNRVAASLRASAASDSLARGTQLPDEPLLHPDVSEIASFFYGKSSEQRRALVASHVALCPECAESLAVYAQAEHAASQYEPSKGQLLQFPAKARELINDWENSSFAKPRTPAETMDGRTLDKLIAFFREHRDDLREVVRSSFTQSRGTVFAFELVPVAVVTHGGELMGVELFERIPDEPGTELLEHADRSERLNRRKLHAVVQSAGGSVTVVSEQIDRYGTRLRYSSATRGARTDYFVFED
jgi:hypothetical protein